VWGRQPPRHDVRVVPPTTPTESDATTDVPATIPTDAELEPVEGARAEPAVDGRPWYRRVDRKLVLASLIIAFGLVLIVFGLSRSVTGDDVVDLPRAIEDITPRPDDVQVLQQTNVVVDLAQGYEGRLVIDDIALPTIRQNDLAASDVAPGQQVVIPPGVVFEPGNGTLTFTPGGDNPIDSFEPGPHTVQAIFWRTVDGEERARSYTWSFTTI